MTENIINFKSAKKRVNYAKKEKLAAENRKKFGLTKAEKRLDTFETSKAVSNLDDRKLDDE